MFKSYTSNVLIFWMIMYYLLGEMFGYRRALILWKVQMWIRKFQIVDLCFASAWGFDDSDCGSVWELMILPLPPSELWWCRISLIIVDTHSTTVWGLHCDSDTVWWFAVSLSLRFTDSYFDSVWELILTLVLPRKRWFFLWFAEYCWLLFCPASELSWKLLWFSLQVNSHYTHLRLGKQQLTGTRQCTNRRQQEAREPTWMEEEERGGRNGRARHWFTVIDVSQLDAPPPPPRDVSANLFPLTP